MSTLMENDIKRRTAKREAALGLEIVQGKTTVSEASRAFDLSPSDVAQWSDEGKRGMENALRTKPLEVKEQHEKQRCELQEAYDEAMLALRAGAACGC
jgi:transposase-like protein